MKVLDFRGLMALPEGSDGVNKALLEFALDGGQPDLHEIDAGDLACLVLTGIAELSRMGYHPFTILWHTSRGINRTLASPDEPEIVDDMPATADGG